MPGEFYVEEKWIKERLKELLSRLEGLETRIDAIEVESGKWAGDGVEDTATGLDLNGGIASSGDPGADIFTIPAAGRIEILCAIISMRNVTALATVTVRAYTSVNGMQDLVYSQDFTQGADPEGIMVINGNFGANEPIRFEMYSDNVLDTNVDVPYKAIWRLLE